MLLLVFSIALKTIFESTVIFINYIGKLQSMGITGESLMMIGDKGIAFFDEEGANTGSVTINNIQGSVWSDQLCFVITDNQISAIAIKNKNMTDTLPFSPMNNNSEMFFSEDGNYITVIEDNKKALQYYIRVGKAMGLK